MKMIKDKDMNSFIIVRLQKKLRKFPENFLADSQISGVGFHIS